MKEKFNIKKGLAICLVCVMCVLSVFSTDAAKKIKSKSVDIHVKKITIGIGDIASLDATMKPLNSTDKLSWSSSNKNIATVNKYGVVTGLQEGDATITVKTSSKKYARCKVTVRKYLTEKDVSSLIQTHSIDEQTIKDYVEKYSVSSNTVLELIKANSLSESTVKELIANNSVNENEVKKIVQENTLTEEEVRKIIKEELPTTTDDWEDGTRLTLDSAQTLPYSENGITLESIEVRKYRYTGKRDGYNQKYKYTFEIKGKSTEDISEDGDYNAFVYFSFISKNGSASGGIYYYKIENQNHMNCDSVCVLNEDGSFTLTVDQYGLLSDYSYFWIDSITVEKKINY